MNSFYPPPPSPFSIPPSRSMLILRYGKTVTHNINSLAIEKKKRRWKRPFQEFCPSGTGNVCHIGIHRNF